MYKRPGSKLKTIATVFFAIGSVISIIAGARVINVGIRTDSASSTITGVAIIALGILASWLANILIYAFGELVDNSNRLVEIGEQLLYDSSRSGINPTEFDGNNEQFSQVRNSQTYYDDTNKSSISPLIQNGDCVMCGKTNVPTAYCTLKGQNGTVSRFLCVDCIRKYKAAPAEQYYN